VRLFGALDDRTSPYTQKAQYQAAKLFAYFAHRVGPGVFSSSLEAQYSRDELYGSEALYIGGQYSVRGFKNDGAQGDSGLVSRNEYELNLGRILQEELMLPFSVSVFYDLGRVTSRNKNYSSPILAGTGVKLSARYRYFEGTISYAAVTRKHSYMRDNNAIYTSLSFVYNF